ncbi:hypothetical protein FNE72_28310 [Klebsiella pneumoniae]|uniref:hypothetical protein n=1 Tax=Klebsiella pneumoniae TaxID=573 RepID=UPI00124B5B0F|nr:hypothetical protein FNE72_28310 [Klebsiella pneumoniae]
MATVRATLDRFTDVTVKSNLQKDSLVSAKRHLKELLHVNPYCPTEAEADALEKFGIATSPFSIKLHSHAAAKAIENRMLEIVGQKLPPREKTTFMFLKTSKLTQMRRDPRRKDVFMNLLLEPRDCSRYGMKTLVSNFLKIQTRTAFMADSLHFMRPNFIQELFTQNPSLEVFYATVVLPVEAIYQHPSMHPDIYQLNYNNGGFQYIPGNHAGGSYHHEFDDLTWLKIGRIHWSEKKTKVRKKQHHWVTVQMEEAMGANLLFSFHRGHMLTPRVRTFSIDTMVLLPKLFHPSNMNATRPIKHTLAMQLLLYCKSVKQCTERDLYAKIRQLIKTSDLKNFYPQELVHIVNYFYFTTSLESITCYEDIIGASIWKKTLVPVKAYIRHYWEKFCGSSSFSKLLQALQWETFTYSIPVTDYKVQMVSGKPEWQPDERDHEYDLSDTLGNETDSGSEKDEDYKPECLANCVGKCLGHCKKELLKPEEVSMSTKLRQNSALQMADEEANNDNHTVTNEETSPLDSIANLLEQKAQQEREQEEYLKYHAPLVRVDNRGAIERLDLRREHQIDTSQQASTSSQSAGSGNSEQEEENRLIESLTNLNGDQISYPEPEAKQEVNTTWPFTKKAPKSIISLDLTSTTRKHVALKRKELAESLSNQALSVNVADIKPQFLDWKSNKQGKNDVACGVYRPGTKIGTSVVQKTSKTINEYNNALAKEKSLTLARTKAPNLVTKEDFKNRPLKPRSIPWHRLPDKDVTPWDLWLPILERLGFKGDDGQYDPMQRLIYPISDVRKLPEAPYPNSVPPALQAKLNEIVRKPVWHVFDTGRARAYSGDVKYCKIGQLLKAQSEAWRDGFHLATEQTPVKMPIVVIHGAGGSGKSKFIQDWLLTLPSDTDLVTIVLPTNELRVDWESKVPHLEKGVFKTYEKAMLQSVGRIVIMDDYSKLPPGYVEAFIMYFTDVEFLILTGDSRQSSYIELEEDAMIRHLEPSTTTFSLACRYYINATHRNFQDLANALGVYSEKNGMTCLTMNSQFKKGWPILVPSYHKMQNYSSMGVRCMTYAGSQGLTAPKVQILLDFDTEKCSDEVMYTALSRAVSDIHFINTGPNSNDFWMKLDATPYLKTFLDTVKEQTVQKILDTEAKALPTPVPPLKTHIAVDEGLSVLQQKVDEQGEKYSREIHSSATGYSNAIQTEDPLVQLYQHQQAKDETLLWATIEKRLKTASKEANLRNYSLRKDIGDLLFLSYAKAMGLPDEPIPFNEELWTHCAHEVQQTYLSKPVHMLKNAQLRQSPDFPKNKIKIFLKSQWVTKLEKMGTIVKPGQTIASFHQQTVMVFGTMARYMRKMREAFCPPNIFINCEKKPEDLNTFLAAHWNFEGMANANDYTAFDQSQDGNMLQFEVIKAKFHSIPEDIIQDYIDIKTNADIFLGTLSIMRLTGEGPTFDANTECSIAYQHLKYQFPENCAQLYAGDDFACDAEPQQRQAFNLIKHQLALTEKSEMFQQEKGAWANFCGSLITPLGALKDPIKLLGSWQLAKRTGRLNNVKTSYALDAKTSYSVGDGLHDVFTDEQLRAHFALIRDMHLHGVAHHLVLE